MLNVVGGEVVRWLRCRYSVGVTLFEVAGSVQFSRREFLVGEKRKEKRQICSSVRQAKSSPRKANHQSHGSIWDLGIGNWDLG